MEKRQGMKEPRYFGQRPSYHPHSPARPLVLYSLHRCTRSAFCSLFLCSCLGCRLMLTEVHICRCLMSLQRDIQRKLACPVTWTCCTPDSWHLTTRPSSSFTTLLVTFYARKQIHSCVPHLLGSVQRRGTAKTNDWFPFGWKRADRGMGMIEGRAGNSRWEDPLSVAHDLSHTFRGAPYPWPLTLIPTLRFQQDICASRRRGISEGKKSLLKPIVI